MVFAVLVDEVELPQRFQKRYVRSRVIDDAFRSVLDQKFEELKRLLQSATWRLVSSGPSYFVYLPPFLGRLLGKALVHHGHDLVELLAGDVRDKLPPFVADSLVESAVGNFLHQRGRGA